MGVPGRVRLAVFDVSGRLVRRLMDGMAEAGPHSISWDGAASTGSPAGGGVYFARLETAAGSRTLKVIQVAR